MSDHAIEDPVVSQPALAPTPYVITYPPELPVSAHCEAIRALLQQHAVLIVCGETGSGKTTQLPKILLQLLDQQSAHVKPESKRHKPARPRLIGHTQPRRIAASSVAQRLAQELQTPLGAVVGYKVRFSDRLQNSTRIKLMTDGVLLAETQSDPLLKNYSALIIDEAHERSLNIDFLLGYLRHLLPKRPDLKVIITSATLDAERFATHFDLGHGPAPIVQVQGRSFAVEQRWRPFEESRDYGLEHAVADAVDELWHGTHSGGDILVFLPGERDIRSVAEHLRGHTAKSSHSRGCEILSLFARLSQAEQERVFAPHEGRRIVLSTNVAETSLTVPGIRHVIDSGLARVKRYSYRNKVEQLHIEPISQAAARQRAGRCGRVADGICIRLYDEAGFSTRAPFTDPEVLRSSLAAVILRMKALHLEDIGDVVHFPFIDMPSGRAIADGYQLLQELAAVDELGRLTSIGQQLARLPIDPRVARMVLAAQERGVAEEILVIAAALSIQDPREYPQDAKDKALAAHALFADAQSEFCSLLNIWHWVHSVRTQENLSVRQTELRWRSQFLNPRRLREWRETWQQLRSILIEQKLLHPAGTSSGPKAQAIPALTLPLPKTTFEQLHRSLLTGLLGNIGLRREEEPFYQGARGNRIFLSPGMQLKRKPGRWIVAAELIDTQKLYARTVASIDPSWIEDVASHLIKRQVQNPHWEKHSGKVVALARGTLYGLMLYQGRKTDFAQLDPNAAREIFIRSALVQGDWDCPFPFLAHNLGMQKRVEELEHKQRRQDVLVDDSLIYAFYDQHLPAQIVGAHSFKQWYQQAQYQAPHRMPTAPNPQTPAQSPAGHKTNLLFLSQQELMRHEAAGITTEAFPKLIRLGGIDCSAHYKHEIGDARDGLSVDLPLFVLNQVQEERCEWLVPGMLKEKITALLKSLPQRPRARLLPLAHTAERYATTLPFASGSLLGALCAAIQADTSLMVKPSDFRLDSLPVHLFMHLRLMGEDARHLSSGRNLAKLKAEWGPQARGAFATLAQLHITKINTTQAQHAATTADLPLAADTASPSPSPSPTSKPRSSSQESDRKTSNQAAAQTPAPAARDSSLRYTAWSFGALPEIMELQHGEHSVIGFPALIEAGDAVQIAVFDDPDLAQQKHLLGLAGLVRLQLRDNLKYLEKNIPDWQKMAMHYVALGSQEELKAQIMEYAIYRAFLQPPLPCDAASFEARIAEGKGRLNLIAQEIARLTARILQEYTLTQRRVRDSRPPPAVATALRQQLERLVPKDFLRTTPADKLPHLPRYLQAIGKRLDKLKDDPARDAERMKMLQSHEQRLQQELNQRKGQSDPRLEELRWMLEELRVSLFAQELKTPQPVSVKRLEKLWEQIRA